MSQFASLNDTKINVPKKDNYLDKDGDYTLELVEAKAGANKLGENYFLIRTKVLLSSTYNGAIGEPYLPGEEVTHFIKLRGFSWQKDIKLCVAAFSGVDPNEVDEKGVLMVAGPSQPLKGKKARVRAQKKANGTFTKTFWSAV